MRRSIAAWLTPALVVVCVLQSAAPAQARSPHAAAIHRSASAGDLAARVRDLLRWGYVRTPAYIAAKARIDSAFLGTGQPSPAARPETGTSPVTGESFAGLSDPSVSPSAATGAVGPTRFIELVQEKYGIYDRTVSPPTLISTGTLADFAGVGGDLPFDPNIIWDPGTARFYYAMGQIVSGPPNGRIAWGFSQTDTPDTTADWCHYSFDFGIYGATGDFPDFPRLGDTADFLLIGDNVFPMLSTYARSDVAWIAKPPPGPGCPPPESFLQGVQVDVRQHDGTNAFSPVPANQIDDDGVGYVVASTDLGSPGRPGTSPSATSSKQLTVLTVTKNFDGTANITPIGHSVVVGKYSIPPDAPQKNTSSTLDTFDARLTNAQEAFRPELGKNVLYTQHTVAGGAGSMVRVYMIDPVTFLPTTTTVKNRKRSVFNAAVTSDRRVDATLHPAAAAYGDSIVVGFNQSSVSTFPNVGMISQIDSGARSPIVVVASSMFSETGCQPCPLGASTGGSPDPSSTTRTDVGAAWLSSQRTGPGGEFGWRTWNWSAIP